MATVRIYSEVTFQIDIVTPERQTYSGQVHSVRLPGVEGDFGVLVGHAPLMMRPVGLTVSGLTEIFLALEGAGL